ncbi:MAG: sodium-dependent transporter [Alphaproteobacteria bacterium]|jgi:NSS family neurotransmitter:Na+ symporter|nr:sodium-dependent transporter [Alphaproteobacteria bacterium]
MTAIQSKTEHWGSRFGFLMAAVGSSVGLGNLWRFPFTAGENGGSAFIIIYLACVVLLGLPVLMAEYAVGRKGQRSAISGIRHIARSEGKSPAWTAIGWIGALTALSIFSFYIVIAAWVFDFIPQAFSGRFEGFDAEASAANFENTIGNRGEILLYLGGFLALNVLIVARGIHSGIERAAEILMPAFFVMLFGMVIFALVVGDAGRAAGFLLAPDFSKVGFGTFLSAVGQAFFSIGVGSCLMVTYGAYLERSTQIPNVSYQVASADTFVAIIAGFAIFPVVFGFGLDPAGGGGLFFVTMPVAFGQMPLGGLVGGLFFTLALFAAFTSSISLFEVGVSWLEDQPWISRAQGAVALGLILFLAGVGYIYHGAWIDHIDFVTGSLLLPLGGILMSLFAGWVLSRESIEAELGRSGVVTFVRILLRYAIPPALAFILIFGVIDKLQDNYGIDLPPVMERLLGPNG